jgi:hypothetical protein
MSRSGYIDECEDVLAAGRWRAQVASATRGKRGQAFLRELLAAMDAMPVKALIANDLINDQGDCCTIGVVCKARGLDVKWVDVGDPASVAKVVDIAKPLAAEIEYENDEGSYRNETPEERWERMRRWVEKQIKAPGGGDA